VLLVGRVPGLPGLSDRGLEPREPQAGDLELVRAPRFGGVVGEPFVWGRARQAVVEGGSSRSAAATS
jgi:hypothetical protein